MKKQKILDRLKITPEKEQKARENLALTPLEKKDFWALVIASFISFVIPTIIVIGIIVLILWLIITLITL